MNESSPIVCKTPQEAAGTTSLEHLNAVVLDKDGGKSVAYFTKKDKKNSKILNFSASSREGRLKLDHILYELQACVSHFDEAKRKCDELGISVYSPFFPSTEPGCSYAFHLDNGLQMLQEYSGAELHFPVSFDGSHFSKTLTLTIDGIEFFELGEETGKVLEFKG